MKIVFRGYKVSEVEQYLADLNATHEKQLAELKVQLENLQHENEQLQRECADLKKRESGISEVLISATVRAQSIEKEYQEKAAESDRQYDRIRREWSERIAACRNGIAALQAATEEATQKLKEEINTFARWNDSELLNFEKLPQIEMKDSAADAETDSAKKNAEAQVQEQEEQEIDLEQEILKGASVDLMDACKALGLVEDEN